MNNDNFNCEYSYNGEHSGIPISKEEWECSHCNRNFLIG